MLEYLLIYFRATRRNHFVIEITCHHGGNHFTWQAHLNSLTNQIRIRMRQYGVEVDIHRNTGQDHRIFNRTGFTRHSLLQGICGSSPVAQGFLCTRGHFQSTFGEGDCSIETHATTGCKCPAIGTAIAAADGITKSGSARLTQILTQIGRTGCSG